MIPAHEVLQRLPSLQPQVLVPCLLVIDDRDVQLVAWPFAAVTDLVKNYPCKDAPAEFVEKGYTIEVGTPERKIYIKEA